MKKHLRNKVPVYCYPPAQQSQIGSVDVYVRRLREKIEPEPDNPRYLKTVHGTGYRFELPKQH